MHLWFMSGWFCWVFFLPKLKCFILFCWAIRVPFFKQKLICLYDFDLQGAHKTQSKYLLCITQNRNLITCFILSWYLSLSFPKIKYDGSNETYLPKCLHSLLVPIMKALIQQSSQVSALILSTNSHIKSIHHFL